MRKSRRLVSINISALLILGFIAARPARSPETDQLIDKALKSSGITGPAGTSSLIR